MHNLKTKNGCFRVLHETEKKIFGLHKKPVSFRINKLKDLKKISLYLYGFDNYFVKSKTYRIDKNGETKNVGYCFQFYKGY